MTGSILIQRMRTTTPLLLLELRCPMSAVQRLLSALRASATTVTSTIVVTGYT